MSILSLEFALFVFVSFIVYWLVNQKYRWIVLLLANYIFYSFADIKYLVILLIITIVSYSFGIVIEKRIEKKLYLSFGIIICISTLFIFKYLDFSISTINILFKTDLSLMNLILPLGISFYTLEAIGYMIDVYRGQDSEKHLGYYACYLSLFPTITSGPIERSKQIIIQLKENKSFTCVKGDYSLKLLTWGIFKKIVIADNIASYINPIYSNVTNYKGLVLLVVIFLYTIQIYADFSGYSDIARGLAGLFGINLVDNFKQPYFSTTIKEFWSKWHISLSSWLKDYVYIPLGGNRCSKLRHYLNLLITFLISGLWHGANVTYVVWGGIHGVLQIIENAFHIKSEKNRYSLKWWIRCAFLFVILSITWVFFRADTFTDALYILNPSNIFEGILNPIVYISQVFSELRIDRYIFIGLINNLILIFIFDFFVQKIDILEFIGKQKTIIKYMIYVTIILIILISKPTEGITFVYGQF